MFEISQKYLSDLDIDQDHIMLLESPLGTGKTTAIIKYIQDKEVYSVLFVMFRRSLTNNLSGKLLEAGEFMVNYQQIPGTLKQHRMMIQVESLHRLGKFDFDLVVIDEITSVLTQFGSPFHRQRLDSNRENFQKLMNCPRVILMDGFIDERAVDFVLNSTKRPVRYVRNRIKTDFRKYTWIKESDILIYTKNAIKNNLKVVIPCGTKTFAGRITHQLRRDKVKVLFFSGDARQTDDPTLLTNINEAVLDYEVLIFTPTLQAGVDISVEHFDVMIAYGSAWSCCARDFVQMLWRVRKIKTNEVFLATQFSHPEPTETEDSPETWDHLTHQVTVEQNASIMNFRKELKRFLGI